MQYALPKEAELGATIHAAPDQLEAVGLPFNVAVAPGLGNRCAHGIFILLEPGDEAAEFAGGSLQPRYQSGGIVLVQEIGEGAYILGCPLQARSRIAECLGEGAIFGRQRGWITRQPPGDAACRGGSG